MTGFAVIPYIQGVMEPIKTADCTGPRDHAFFQSLHIHVKLFVFKDTGFFLVFSKILAHRKKKYTKKLHSILL